MQQPTDNESFFLYRAFALSVFIAPFVLLPSLSEFANLPQSAWLQVTTFFFLSIFLLSRSRQKGETAIRSSPLLLPMAALLLWCFVGLSYAINPYEVIKRLSHLLAAGAAFFLVLQMYGAGDRSKTILWAISLSGLGVALIGISQHLFGLSLIPQIAPPAATFANKNMAAHFVVLTIPATMMLILIEREKYAYLLPMALALQTSFLAYTRNRASWLALLIIATLTLLFFTHLRCSNPLLRISKRQGKGLIIGLLITLGLVAFGKTAAFTGYQNIITRLEESQAYVQEPGRQVRYAFWLNTMAMAKDHAIRGVGLGNFKTHYPLYHDAVLTDHSFTVKRQAVDTHNDLLQAMAELGLIGIGLLLWLGIRIIRQMSNVREQQKPEKQIVAGYAAIGLAAFFIIALFSFPMACSMPPFLAALYLGLLACTSSKTKKLSVAHARVRGYGLVVCGICLLLGIMNYRDLKADYFLARFIDLENQQQWPAALLVGQKMVRTQPLRHQLVTYLGRAYMNTGNLSQAEKSFSITLQTSPMDINTMTNLGAAYLQSGQYRLAQKFSEKALTVYADNWAACNNIGTIHMQQRQYAKAKEYLEKASTMRGQSKLVWFNLGEASLKCGDMEIAGKAFEKALMKDPSWTEAKERLFEVQKTKKSLN